MTAKVHEEWAQVVGRAGFQVKKVEVVGADRIDRLKVYDIALAQKDRSMAAVDLADVRSDLMRYGWIKDARVSRRLPDTLVVDIVERTPAAIWQHGGRLSLIDEKGVVLEPVTVATMPDLLFGHWTKANQRSQDLDRLLAEASSLKELPARRHGSATAAGICAFAAARRCRCPKRAKPRRRRRWRSSRISTAPTGCSGAASCVLTCAIRNALSCACRTRDRWPRAARRGARSG